VRPSPTASPTEFAATTTLSTAATETEPRTIVIVASATPLPSETVATARLEIAPANLTLTAIRATIAERRELTATNPSPTVSSTDITETATPSATATETDPPTKTLVALTFSPTPTPLPFYFAYLVPTPTAYRPVEDDFRIDCQVRGDWIPYEVRAGDSMLSLALSSGVSLLELRGGNCFEPIRGIFAGETLLVPQLPELPIEVPAPEFSIEDAAEAMVGCDDRSARIVAPAPLEHVEGVFALVGSARLPAGGKYHIALKPGWSNEYFLYLVSEQAVSNDVLGLINSELFGMGAHRIQLTVLDDDGELIEGGICEIELIFGSS
ncbi:MAG: hypothetical protein OXG49_03425, partial [Chloroflexi bacterium]|nr:hypothetical protein [Chloroflexota bacterium]